MTHPDIVNAELTGYARPIAQLDGRYYEDGVECGDGDEADEIDEA